MPEETINIDVTIEAPKHVRPKLWSERSIQGKPRPATLEQPRPDRNLNFLNTVKDIPILVVIRDEDILRNNLLQIFINWSIVLYPKPLQVKSSNQGVPTMGFPYKRYTCIFNYVICMCTLLTYPM